MKKIISALLLASMLVAALASCSGGEDDTTTTTAGTTTPAATTTAKAPPKTEPPEETPDPTPPVLAGEGLEELIAGKTKLTVDMAQVGAVDFDSWNEETENVDELFDGIKTSDDWFYTIDETTGEKVLKPGADPENPDGSLRGGGPGKCGGDAKFGIGNSAWFYFALTEEAKASAYIITTGNDNAVYTVRNPVEWTLYGTNDADAFAAAIAGGITAPVSAADYPFDETKWTMLDYVYDGQIAQGNFLENGYTIDAEAQQSFKYYCWNLGYTGDGNFQACEFELFAG